VSPSLTQPVITPPPPHTHISRLTPTPISLSLYPQVVALCSAPFLLDDPNVHLLFPSDAVARARTLLASFGVGGVGGYTDSRGNILVRNEVADFIERRDGHRPQPEVRGREGGQT